jgi:hypothetical protein
MICDVCNRPIDLDDFYILQTAELACSPGYWDHVLKLSDGLPPAGLRDHPEKIDPIADQIASYRSNWAICPDCIVHLDADRERTRQRARKYATQGNGATIPTRAADPQRVRKIARAAWERRFGTGQAATRAGLASARIIADEIGTQRAGFWRWFKQRLGR